jgi:restriction system protein
LCADRSTPRLERDRDEETAETMTTLKRPKFIQYFQPVIDGLRELGSSAKPREVYEWIIDHHPVATEEIENTTKNGQPKFESEVVWAVFYLAKWGLLNIDQRGIWVLTETGRRANLSDKDARILFDVVHDGWRDNAAPGEAAIIDKLIEDDDAGAPDERAYLNQRAIQEKLVSILRDLTDSGFEELCVRLLRHLGFENLKVKRLVGSHGIDGEGYLLINRLVRIKVMFRGERQSNSVQATEICDFRDAIKGRAERGIFLTTGTFTKGARDEAEREHATGIELINLDRLVELLIEERLGVRETKALTIDHTFFAAYQPIPEKPETPLMRIMRS